MQPQIYIIAELADIDQRLAELEEEYGDLPKQVKHKEEIVEKCQALVDETAEILKNIKSFCSTSKVTLVELKEKEEKLAKQQFQVRNNKEFDAITKEIANIKKEHETLTDKLRTEGVKQENITRILNDQKKDLDEAKKEFNEINSELTSLSSDQNNELKDLQKKRKELTKKLQVPVLTIYERVHSYHTDAAVYARKNSCTGCYSSQPAQKIVEIRNNLDKIFTCEACGRILIPEE